MTHVKFCGMRRMQDIAYAAALRCDYVGFVFAPGSRRYLRAELAAQLRAQLRALAPGTAAVGVFVNAPCEEVCALLSAGVIDIAQLHGTEDEDEIAALRARSGKPVWKAVQVRTAEDIARANASCADLILLDHGTGGSGSTFDWSLLRGMCRSYLLAGGLTPDNAAQAVRSAHPWGLDVSSGIETGGWKDRAKMAAFMAAVRKEDMT